MDLYLLFVGGALIAVVTVFIQLDIAVITAVTKFYFDRWGPNPTTGPGAKAQLDTHSMSLRTAVKVDISKLFSGEGGAPFPLLQPPVGHAAQHLLLECRLSSAPPQGLALEEKEVRFRLSSSKDLEAAIHDNDSKDIGIGTGCDVLKRAGEMLETALVAEGLAVQQRHMKSLPSFKSMKSTIKSRPTNAKKLGTTQPTTNSTLHDMCFIGCRDGYCNLVWYGSSRTLAVDIFAAGGESAVAMSDAAHRFGAALLMEFPGSKIPVLEM